MNSIEDIFDNSNQLIDGIHHFFDQYIGNSLLRKSGIHKIVDKIMSKGYEYPDHGYRTSYKTVTRSQHFVEQG